MNTKYQHFILLSAILCACNFTECFSQHPNIGGFTVYYGDLHNHSGLSDGEGTVKEAFQFAKDTSGYDFFGISDHGEMLTNSEWLRIKETANLFNEENEFITFWGFEWSSILFGHTNIIGSEDFCSSLTLSTLTFSSLIKWVNSNECIAFFNHPGYINSGNNEFNHFENKPSDRFIGMELWNDDDGFDRYLYNDGYFSDDNGLSYFDEAIQRGWYIGAWGADDNHDADWGKNEFQIGVLGFNLTREDLWEALNERRFFSSLDKNIEMSFKINGNEMGSRIHSGEYEGEIRLHDKDNEIFTKIDLIRRGLTIESYNIYEAKPIIPFYVNTVGGDYYYILVTQEDGDQAISSPVFINDLVSEDFPPDVEIIYPVNGQIISPGIITIYAEASDYNGLIRHIAFYANDTFLGIDNDLPYSFTFNAGAGETINLSAIAFDDKYTSTLSRQATIYTSGETLTDCKSDNIQLKLLVHYIQNITCIEIEGIKHAEQIELIDLMGKKLANVMVFPGEITEIPESVPNGIYLIQIKNRYQTGIFKIVIK